MNGFADKDKLQIIAFQTYGTQNHFYARGRALEDESIDLEQKGILNLLINTYKRFETDEVGDTPISISLKDNTSIAGETDREGYYLIDQQVDNLSQLANDEGWVKFEISVADTDLKREIIHKNKFPGRNVDSIYRSFFRRHQ